VRTAADYMEKSRGIEQMLTRRRIRSCKQGFLILPAVTAYWRESGNGDRIGAMENQPARGVRVEERWTVVKLKRRAATAS